MDFSNYEKSLMFKPYTIPLVLLSFFIVAFQFAHLLYSLQKVELPSYFLLMI
ncbi:hypothetical protein RV13_GL000697 [Enterococcus raffinosus]|nr:hypothetical protein RV13_GL000697 [Enterococcus raffinosus]